MTTQLSWLISSLRPFHRFRLHVSSSLSSFGSRCEVKESEVTLWTRPKNIANISWSSTRFICRRSTRRTFTRSSATSHVHQSPSSVAPATEHSIQWLKRSTWRKSSSIRPTMNSVEFDLCRFISLSLISSSSHHPITIHVFNFYSPSSNWFFFSTDKKMCFITYWTGFSIKNVSCNQMFMESNSCDLLLF